VGGGRSSQCGEIGRAGVSSGSLNNEVVGSVGTMQSELSKGSVYIDFTLVSFGAVVE